MVLNAYRKVDMTLENDIVILTRQNKTLTELSDALNDKIKEQRLIIARLSGDLAVKEKRLEELSLLMADLVNALFLGIDFLKEYSWQIDSFYKKEALDELIKEMSIVEKVE